MNFSVSENKESQHKSERLIYQSLAKTKPREKNRLWKKSYVKTINLRDRPQPSRAVACKQAAKIR